MTGVVDDFVVRRGDGGFAYNLAVVVDDTDAGRRPGGARRRPAAVGGQPVLAGPPAGSDPPTYAHVPLAVNAAGARLAKRDGAVTLAELAARGRPRRTCSAWLAVSLGLAEPGEPVGVADLLPRFDPERLPRGNPGSWY